MHFFFIPFFFRAAGPFLEEDFVGVSDFLKLKIVLVPSGVNWFLGISVISFLWEFLMGLSFLRLRNDSDFLKGLVFALEVSKLLLRLFGFFMIVFWSLSFYLMDVMVGKCSDRISVRRVRN